MPNFSLVAAAYPLRAAVLVEENADDSVALGERSLLLQERNLWLQIARTPALTMAGLIAKLGFAATCYEPSEREDFEEGTADEILESVAIDFKDMKAVGDEA